MTSTLSPDVDGTSQGDWLVVGGSTREEVLDGDSATYVWIDNAVTGNYFDQRMDPPNGEIANGVEMKVSICARNTGGRVCKIKVQVFDGEPNDPGTKLLEIVTVTLTADWVTYEDADTWSGVLTKTSNFVNLWTRLEVQSITGPAGDPPDVEVCLMDIEVPRISKSVVTHRRHLAPLGVHTVHSSDGSRHRKITFDGEWSFRNGEPFENLARSVIFYEVAGD